MCSLSSSKGEDCVIEDSVGNSQDSCPYGWYICATRAHRKLTEEEGGSHELAYGGDGILLESHGRV